MQWECLDFMPFERSLFGNCRSSGCRIEDYWEGYKLFCYAYYSHSMQHESEFRETKLGSFFHSTNWFVVWCFFPLVLFGASVFWC